MFKYISKMKKSIFLLFIGVSSTIYAQDTIRKTNGTTHIGKVLEISNEVVRYKLQGTDVLFEINKTDIAQINFQNGIKEVYVVVAHPKPPVAIEKPSEPVKDVYYDKDRYVSKTEPVKKEYGKNIFALNVFEMFFTNLGVSYERMLGDGALSIKIPFALGLGGRPNYNSYTGEVFSSIPLQNKNYSTGLELNFYPIKQTKSTFYIGLSGNYCEFKYYNYQSSYPYPSPQPTLRYYYTGKQYSGMIHLGGNIGLTDNLLLGGKVAVGLRREETINDDFTMSRIQLDLNLAYRF